MRCPYCNYTSSKVLDSRSSADGIRRRRECFQCSLRYTTYERIQTTALMVAKRDGRRQEFNRDQLTNSILKACVKRPIATGRIEKLVDEIEAELQQLGRAEIHSSSIGEMVMERLRDMDRVAYIRFASVYRDFADIESFKQEVEALQEALEREVPSPQLPLIPDDPPAPKRRGRRPRAAQGLPMDLGNGASHTS